MFLNVCSSLRSLERSRSRARPLRKTDGTAGGVTSHTTARLRFSRFRAPGPKQRKVFLLQKTRYQRVPWGGLHARSVGKERTGRVGRDVHLPLERKRGHDEKTTPERDHRPRLDPNLLLCPFLPGQGARSYKFRSQ